MGHSTSRCLCAWLLFWGILALNGCHGFHRVGEESDLNATEPDAWPRPAFFLAGEPPTIPGLSVVHLSKKIRHIDEMPGVKWMAKNGLPGKPIQMIDHQFGNGDVFDSGKSHRVCVQIQGYVSFRESGRYQIKANSNDGIRVFLDNKMILNDPDIHADRFTPAAEIDIKQPGKYAVLVRYFQRKGSATLELYWKTPGAETFVIIPAMAYSHASPVS